MISSKQRAYLRGLANDLPAIMQIGKGGLSENLLKTFSDALEARELIKLRCLETAGISSREAADRLAEKCRANTVQVIGSKFVLYRPASDPKARKIELPADKKKK